MPKIITSGLAKEFEKSKSGTITVGKEALERSGLGRIVTAETANTRIVESFFNPWLQRTTLELPTQYKDLVKWRRYFYHNEPIVSSALELHSQFPLSTFFIEHQDKKIKNDFERMCDNIELFEFLLEMLLEFWTNGEANVFGFFDNPEDPQMWTDFVLLDPTLLDIQWDPLARGRKKEIIKLEPSKTIKTIVSNGPSSKETGDLYKALPSDVIESAKKGQKMTLNSLQTSHIKRTGDYFSTRGTSIIDRAFKLLMYRDKLRSAQYAVADRHISPKEYYFLGETGAPANQEEIDAFRDLLVSQWSQPNSAIVYHHAVRVQWEGASGRILPLQPEFQYLDKQLAIALLINEGVITAERQPYASTSIGLDVMIQRYLTLRMRVENWIENKVFKPICEIHKIVKRTKAELEYGIRFNKKDVEYDIPKVKWDKTDLANDLNKIRVLIEMADKGWLPKDMIYPYLGLDTKTVKKGLEAERKEGKYPVPGAPGAPGGIGGEGFLPEGAPPPEEPLPEGAMEGGLPEMAEGEGYGAGFPPESAEAAAGGGGLPTAV